MTDVLGSWTIAAATTAAGRSYAGGLVFEGAAEAPNVNWVTFEVGMLRGPALRIGDELVAAAAPMNVECGVVHYTFDGTARWRHSQFESGIGTGRIDALPRPTGTTQVTYARSSGEELGAYELTIAAAHTGSVALTWRQDGAITSLGVGLWLDDGLAAAWGRPDAGGAIGSVALHRYTFEPPDRASAVVATLAAGALGAERLTRVR